MLFLQSCYTFSNAGDTANGVGVCGEVGVVVVVGGGGVHNETQCLQADAVAKISKVWLVSEGPPSSSAGCLGLAGCSTAVWRGVFFSSRVGRAAGANICKLRRGL